MNRVAALTRTSRPSATAMWTCYAAPQGTHGVPSTTLAWAARTAVVRTQQAAYGDKSPSDKAKKDKQKKDKDSKDSKDKEEKQKKKDDAAAGDAKSKKK